MYTQEDEKERHIEKWAEIKISLDFFSFKDILLILCIRNSLQGAFETYTQHNTILRNIISLHL